MSSFEDFMAKVQKDTNGHLDFNGLLEYLDKKNDTDLFLVVHGTQALAKLDVTVTSLNVLREGADVHDIELQCMMGDGRFFTIMASTMIPARFPSKKEPGNYSRIFASKEARDIFFDGIAYRFEVEEERGLAEAQKRQEQFIAWLSKRLNPKG